MAPALDPSALGIFAFGLVAGICPCNSVVCLGLIGYLSVGKDRIRPLQVLKLAIAFSLGTILVFLPLGALAGFIGRYLVFLSAPVAYAVGGILLVLMGLQLLGVYGLPTWSYLARLRGPAAPTVPGALLVGISFGGLTIGRGAPMLIIVLTYIALSQTVVQGVLTMFLYGAGLTIPLVLISSIGGAFGQKVKEYTRISSELANRIIGVVIILIGVYFLAIA
ncbi:MAG TPA: cytochrome c biogenesis protein CcdA, partial [Methanomicrobiales archaeon]|nr:cytochrome c biogenesis protein CcdA [Methanomicrobiales archaeon]